MQPAIKPSMQRILVIGTSGSGKSTLAQRLSARLDVPFFASDHFYWEPGWKIAPPEKVRAQILQVLSHPVWILDGNFDDEHELVWRQADCIIWLDLPLPLITWQVITRNLGWLLNGQPTWSGNRMGLRRALSGVRHALRSYALKKSRYPEWLADLPGTTVWRFYTRQEVEAWLQTL